MHPNHRLGFKINLPTITRLLVTMWLFLLVVNSEPLICLKVHHVSHWATCGLPSLYPCFLPACASLIFFTVLHCPLGFIPAVLSPWEYFWQTSSWIWLMHTELSWLFCNCLLVSSPLANSACLTSLFVHPFRSIGLEAQCAEMVVESWSEWMNIKVQGFFLPVLLAQTLKLCSSVCKISFSFPFSSKYL